MFFLCFDKRYENSFSSAQPTEVDIDALAPDGLVSYAVFVTNNLSQKACDGRRYFDVV